MKRSPAAIAGLMLFALAHLSAKGLQRARGDVRAGWFAGAGGLSQTEAPLQEEALAALEVAEPGGAPGRLSALLAQRPLTLVAFFEPWCGPCRAELPQLQALLQDYQAQGLAVIGVHADGEDADIAAFKAKLGLEFPLLRDTQGAAKAAGIDAVPTLVVFDQAAQVLRHHRGTDAGLRAFVSQRMASQAEPPHG